MLPTFLQTDNEVQTQMFPILPTAEAVICIMKYRHPSLSTVNWFQKNTALTALHRKVSIQKLKSAS
jgi:hypothetical protein